jgi:hypothetical protein
MSQLLSIQDLRVAFRMGKGVRAEAVKGVSFDIPENTTVPSRLRTPLNTCSAPPASIRPVTAPAIETVTLSRPRPRVPSKALAKVGCVARSSGLTAGTNNPS